jgi:hypothetical protein
VGIWALLGAWVCLFIWPLWAGIGWLVALAVLMLYAALFVWPNETGDGGGA